MKQKLLLLILLATNYFFAQSLYEVPLSLPAYDSSNNEMMLITSNSDWSQINNLNIKYFYVAPGDYTSLNWINITSAGSPNSKRYLLLYNGNDTHPGKLPMNNSNLAKVRLRLNGAKYWVIDRMACWNKTSSYVPILLENAKYNVINRFFSHDVGDGISLRNGSHNNTIQNSRIERDRISMFHDRPACGLTNANSPNVRILNTHFVNNEVYNYVDGFQTVLWGDSEANRTNVYFNGTVVDNNHFYIDSLVYTDGNGSGSHNFNGEYALAENAIDLKVGSGSINNQVIISNNKMWGYKKSDEVGTALSSHGAAVVVHFGVRNTVIENNVIFNSDVGITASGVITPSPYSMLNSTIKNNIIYNTKRQALGIYSTKNIKVDNNLIKKSAENYSRWMTGGREWSSDSNVVNVGNSNFSLTNNLIAIGGNKASSSLVLLNTPVISGNQYYYARPNASISDNSDLIHPTAGIDPTSSYCDLVFVTDKFTNSPKTITVPKVLVAGSCIPQPCQANSNTQSKIECGSSYVWAYNNKTYTSSGVYRYYTTSANGCVHIEILNLTLTPCPSNNIFLEAECSIEKGSYWSVNLNNTASNSSQLVSNSGTWNTGGNAMALGLQGVVKYEFNAAAGGSYFLNMRLKTPNGGDSFYFRVNGGTWSEWHTQAVFNSFTWQRKSGLSNVVLNAGSNTFELAFREGSLIVDKIAFMKTNVNIVNEGEDATNCEPQPCSPSSNPHSQSSCGSYTWPENNQTYTSSGVYEFETTNSLGCPHTEILNLTITQSRTINETFTSCDSYTWVRNNQTYTSSGVYQYSYTNSAGCLITRKLTLTITPCASDNVFLEAECADLIGSQWSVVSNSSASNSKLLKANYGKWNQQNVSSGIVTYNFNAPVAGTYYLNARLKTPNGGDSFYFKINTGSWQVWHTQAVFNSFTWQNKSGLSNVTLNSGANTLQIALREGHLEIDKLALMKTNVNVSGSGEEAYNCVGVKSTIIDTEFIDGKTINIGVYPNPFIDELKIELLENVEIKSLQVLNLNGQVVYSGNLNNRVLNLGGLVPGVYFLKLTTDSSVILERIVKQ